MINTELIRVSLRMGAIYVPDSVRPTDEITHSTLMLTHQLATQGYAVSEPLLRVLNTLSAQDKVDIVKVINDIMGIGLNWAPLVKDWQTPTGQTFMDLLITGIINIIYGDNAPADIEGSRLPCGHFIPHALFDIERYNGCPLCGRQFTVDTTVINNHTKPRKTLTLWRDKDIADHYLALLSSPVALDATQVDSLKLLLRNCPMPSDTKITVKETAMLVAKILIDNGKEDEAAALMTSPTDILRFLWYLHIDAPIIVRPKTLLRRAERAGRHHNEELDRSETLREQCKRELKLRYSRSWCRRVARWLNGLTMSPQAACEAMHPHREMWVRFVRALRLPEYARREGFERLRTLLDCFYNQRYTVWAGEVETARNRGNKTTLLSLLSQRPGVMARQLFSTMLHVGTEETLKAFTAVASQLPPRLLLTLGQYADYYFDPNVERVVKPPLSTPAVLDPNPLVYLATSEQRQQMIASVKRVFEDVTLARFAATPTTSKTIYIDPELTNIPLSVGDRSGTIQDANAALQGQRFTVKGKTVRLFMQWGKGMPAQHLDMDLSAIILYPHATAESCAYYQLTATGAQHSGDIRHIPDMVGTAEYIELNLPELSAAGAQYVVFTCNAYSTGMLNPNLVVGWMNAEDPMTVNDKTGVAYDPATVQHQVRVTSSSDRGLVFGVLLVDKGEIVWLELPYGGQNALALKYDTVTAYLKKLKAKITIGELLMLKAEAQGLKLVDTPEGADEAYTIAWALDAARVASTLL